MQLRRNLLNLEVEVVAAEVRYICVKYKCVIRQILIHHI